MIRGDTLDIVVCVKTNPDLQQIRIKDRVPVLEAIPYKVGDLEKNALEAAIQLRDASGVGKITALTVAEANTRVAETIKEALAMGADEAFIVGDPTLRTTDQAGLAAVLAAALRKIGSFDLVLFGEGSTDNYSGQVGPRVAEILGIPQIGYARKIALATYSVRVERNIDNEVETLEAPSPVVVTVVSEINEPRLTSLMNIMKARQKPIVQVALADLGLDQSVVAAQKTVISNLAKEQDRKHVILEGEVLEQVGDLVNMLTKEGVLGR
jgi:electron transfer flavoprotein beta subunit